MNVFLSPWRNPFLNLALEDYFLRGGAELPVCFLYVNRPCVVLGRFQNPWLETHLPYLAESDTWLVRRQSGGGTVFHDEGNLNYSFIVPDPMLDRRKHVELLRRAFATAGIELRISERHDLWLADSDSTWKKISGSAFKQTKSGSFHHGTFLVNSDLTKLARALEETLRVSGSKSIPSVRSKVISLAERFPGTEIEDVVEIICHELGTAPEVLDGTVLSHPALQESFQQLRSEEWLWGETPYFELETASGPLPVHKGRLQRTDQRFERSALLGQVSPEVLDRLFPDFSEQRRSSNLIC
jgi:lipoate-protein ligase A